MKTDVELAAACGWQDACNGFDGDEVPSIKDLQEPARETMREAEMPAESFDACVSAWVASYREKAAQIVATRADLGFE